eukprot:2207103-Pyramimonas_sp.AAC.1
MRLRTRLASGGIHAAPLDATAKSERPTPRRLGWKEAGRRGARLAAMLSQAAWQGGRVGSASPDQACLRNSVSCRLQPMSYAFGSSSRQTPRSA